MADLINGGDTPGMNAAMGELVRTVAEKRWEVLGVKNDYGGLIDEGV